MEITPFLSSVTSITMSDKLKAEFDHFMQSRHPSALIEAGDYLIDYEIATAEGYIQYLKHLKSIMSKTGGDDDASFLVSEVGSLLSQYSKR